MAPDQLAQLLLGPGVERADLPDGAVQVVAGAPADLDEQVLLAADVVVERGAADVELRRDLLDRRGTVPAGGEDPGGRREQLLVALGLGLAGGLALAVAVASDGRSIPGTFVERLIEPATLPAWS
ncbi:MAG TPA: hypothetical protein VNO82_17815 [Solirubrobacteraceae bacterium]|nr:hypothetical protein [Solirubrobacteraceae bacterium]